MPYIPTVERNAAQLGQLARYAEAGNQRLFGAGNNLGELRRGANGPVPVTEPRMAAALAQIKDAQSLLGTAFDMADTLPAKSLAVKHVRDGEKGLADVFRMIGTAPSLDPAALADALPTYAFQEAHLAANHDQRLIAEGLASLATDSPTGALPKSIPSSRIKRLSKGLDAFAEGASVANRQFATAGKISGDALERLRAEHPNTPEVIVERYLLDSWGVSALARDGLRTLGAATDDRQLPPGSDVTQAPGKVSDALEPLRQHPTDGVDEGRVSLDSVVSGLGNASHLAAVMKHEAKHEKHALALVDLYGRRTRS